MNRLVGIVGLATILFGSAVPAEAIPAFARKYGYNCTMCHSTFPRLNDYGQRYRTNGYRLPGREAEERTVLASPPPIAARTALGWISRSRPDSAKTDKLFGIDGLDLLSGGLLGDRIGYFVTYLPQIPRESGVAEQSSALEAASLVWSGIGTSWLNARVGRFEPAYIPFSVKRRLSVAPYEIYDFENPQLFSMSKTQSGVEASGFGRLGLRYAVGWVNGAGTNLSTVDPADFYGRLACIAGPGEGQTAGQRLGVIGYIGKSQGAATADKRYAFWRAGADASLNRSIVNLSLQYLWARDARQIWGMPRRVDFSGGFAELSVFPRSDLAFFGRYDRRETSPLLDADVDRWTAGSRFHVVDNVAVHLEYSQRRPQAQSKDESVVGRFDVSF